MRVLSYLIIAISLVACSPSKQISRSVENDIINTDALKMAHVGISVYDPSTSKYIYDYQGDKFFVPASNTKIPTCYAAMRYLGDSLIGLRYQIHPSSVTIQPTGDPTFLHPDFKIQPVFDFLNSQSLDLYYWPMNSDDAWGNGWSWNDYSSSYMAERSAMPIYGNLARIRRSDSIRMVTDSLPYFNIEISPGFFRSKMMMGNINWNNSRGFSADRVYEDNIFIITPGNSSYVEIPFTHSNVNIVDMLRDTLNKNVIGLGTANKKLPGIVHSRHVDSMLKPMMHHSDNFFAEQSLFMVSNKLFGPMNDARIIDTILNTDLKDLPQRPRWVDGSGLSRYNLFTPRSMVAILEKMKNEFGMDRIKEIFPTGHEGTLTNYYRSASGSIYAKTGTLSGVVALSGYLYTKKNRLLIFSILVNNHRASATDVRRAVEKFVLELREKY